MKNYNNFQVKNRIKNFSLLAGTSMFLFFLGLQTTFAKPFDQVIKNVKSTAGKSGYNTKNVDETTFAGAIGSIVSTVLGFMGILFSIIIIYSGIQWMTAGGDSAKVDKAKTAITNSVIGLAIVLSSMAIVAFVSDVFETALK